LATLPPPPLAFAVIAPQLDTDAEQGESSFSNVWTPANAQLSLVEAQLLSRSVSVIESVVSTRIATLKGPLVDPFAAAVAVAVIVNEPVRTNLRKVSGTVTCCLTAMAFAPAGAPHAIPKRPNAVFEEHQIWGYPDAIVTFGRLGLALRAPDTPLNDVATAAAEELGKACAPANAAAFVDAWSSL
jgi:hypothetical protein